jgi:hypothetical protein
MIKSIIYIIPWQVKLGRKSSTAIRPLEMLKGFKDAGYDVDVIMGSATERKTAIHNIKQKIKKGRDYDFLYGENSTAPLAIAQGKKALLKHGLPDIKFLKFCHRNSIPMGFYYRDIHWKFANHSTSHSWLKRFFSNFLQGRDIVLYNRIMRVLFLPSTDMGSYLPEVKIPMVPLPPGLNKIHYKEHKGDLTFCYVGGLGTLYDLEETFRFFSKRKTSLLIVSTREEDLLNQKERYAPYLESLSIEIRHDSGDALIPLFERSSVALNWVKPDEYYNFAMPLKIFTYLQYGLPIISVKGTANGDFIEKNNLGWVIPYEIEAFSKLICRLENNPQEIIDKRKQIKLSIENHTWISRAIKAGKEITRYSY